MPDIIQCKICKKPFQSFGSTICRSCLKEIDEAFIIIRDYLYDNPDKSNVDEISEATDTPKAIVLQLLKDKRLSVAEDGLGGPTCMYCHRQIGNGTICDNCRKDLAQTLLRGIPMPKQSAKPTGRLDSKGPKMHIDIDRHKK